MSSYYDEGMNSSGALGGNLIGGNITTDKCIPFSGIPIRRDCPEPPENEIPRNSAEKNIGCRRMGGASKRIYGRDFLADIMFDDNCPEGQETEFNFFDEEIRDFDEYINDSEVENDEEFASIVNRIFGDIQKILVIKNTNYDSSFDKLRKEYGPTSFLIRLKDKLFRYESLALSDDKNCDDERIEDTLKDIIGYTMLELIFREKISKEKVFRNE